MKHAALTLFAACFFIACSGSFHDQLEQQPHGAFAANQLETLPSTGEADPLDTPELSTEPGEPSGQDPRAHVVPRAEALETFGILAAHDAIEITREADWSVGDSLTYTEARVAFLGRSTQVSATLQRHLASHTRYGQVDYLNDLVRQYDAFSEELRTHASTPHVMPQRPAWPLQGAGRLQSALADVDVAISFARTSRNLLNTLVEFEETFHTALYWTEAQAIYKSHLRLARQTHDVAQSLYRAGRGEYAHVLLAQNRVDLIKSQVASATERAEAERAQLAALLELPANALSEVLLELKSPPPVLPPREDIAGRVETSPNLLEAEAQAQRSELMVQLVERQLLPEISAGTSNTRTGDVPKRSGDLMYATRAPFLAELKLVRDASLDALEHTRRVVPAQADLQWAALSRALRDLELAGGRLAQRARQALDAAEDAYSAGTLSFFAVDEAQRHLLDIQLSASQHLRAAHLARARLDAATGLARPTLQEDSP